MQHIMHSLVRAAVPCLSVCHTTVLCQKNELIIKQLALDQSGDSSLQTSNMEHLFLWDPIIPALNR